MSYSTNPVLDQMRHQEKVDWAERLREHKEKALCDETMQLAVGGDFARLHEAMDYDDNDMVVFEALISCAGSGSPVATRAIRRLAKTYARLFSEPA